MAEDKNFKFLRITMRDLWLKIIDINLDEYLTREKMWELCKEKKYNVEENENYEELFYRIFLQEIEPELKNMGSVIVYNYPAQMASLSKLSETNPNYAERFEVYIDGLDFIEAVGQMPNSAGIALGVDRLVQLFTSCQNINNVLTLPMSKLF